MSVITGEIPRQRPPRRRRVAETYCPTCEQMVGLIATRFNNGGARAVFKTSRHNNRQARLCAGSALTVPAATVMEVGP